MKRRIVKRPKAEQDLIDHFVYIGQGSVAAANRFLDAVDRTISDLAVMPGLGRHWLSDDRELEGVRMRTVRRFRNYLIFYRHTSGELEILRVLHGARDVEALLRREGF